MYWLARFVIFADLVLPIVYIVSPKFTVLRVAAVAISLAVLLFGSRMEKISRETWSLMSWAFGLILFKLVVDSTIHSDGSLNAVTQFMRELFVILMLPVFEKIGDKKISIVKWMVIFSIPAMILGFLQIADGSFTIPKLLPSNPLLKVDTSSELYIQITSRIVGTYNIAIGFALLLGFLFVIFWSYAITNRAANKKALALAGIAICFILMVFSQTRSAIYGIFPTILLTYLLASPGLAKKAVYTIGGGVLLTVSFAGFQAYVITHSERSEVKIDSSTYYKITANVYGTYAALARDPLFGVPINRDREQSDQEYLELIKEGKAALGTFLKTDTQHKLGATNHNLFAYYMRYYGLIGFFLLAYVIYRYFKVCMSEDDLQLRYMKLGVLVYFIQYSMLHNTQLLETLILWIIIASGKNRGQQYEPEPEPESVSPDVRLQRRPSSLVGTRKHT